MSILIKGMRMPTSCYDCNCFIRDSDGSDYCCLLMQDIEDNNKRDDNCPIVPVPQHGRLIDADALRSRMYHEAFETDTPMQKWDSGCWIRYKMFEQMEESAPTVIPAEESET